MWSDDDVCTDISQRVERMMWLVHTIVTLGPIGRMNASGTVASFVALPIACWLGTTLSNDLSYLGVVSALFVFGWWAVRVTLSSLNLHDEDPSEIVIDEVVGCLMTFWGIGFTAQAVVLGIMMFRFFDISKLAGISRAERCRGGLGIMLDDLLAGLLSNLILRIVL